MKLPLICAAAAAMLVFGSGSMRDCHGAEKAENKSIAVMLPGKGIGNIELGDSAREVIRKMRAKPADGKMVKAAKGPEYWLNYPDKRISFIFNEKKKLFRIIVSNPGIIVKKKSIRVNSSIKDLEAEYEGVSPEAVDKNYLEWKTEGLRFILNRGTLKIESILVERKTSRDENK